MSEYNEFTPEKIKVWHVLVLPFAVVLIYFIISGYCFWNLLLEGVDRLRGK